MNDFRTVNTGYLTPSRTIETVLVSDGRYENVFFVYNYDGYSFNVFDAHLDLINFFQNDKIKAVVEFTTEMDLDDFLSKVNLIP